MPHPIPLFSRFGAPRRTAVAAGLSGLGLGLAFVLALALPAAAQPGKGPTATSAAKPVVSRPTWRELSSRQQRALEPLAANWDELTGPHKQKWLAISRNFAEMSPQEQEMLHSRMTEWSRLSNQQREQARLNFAAVKQVPADERKAKWEAYQALSEEEKRKLAERAATARAVGAAPTVRPAPAQKFALVPTAALEGQRTPRILLAPPAPAETPRLPAPPVPNTPAATGAPVPAEAQVPAPQPAGPSDGSSLAARPGEHASTAP